MLFPPSLDQYITDQNPVRCIDAFGDQLDLPHLGFTGALASRLGRPAYHRGDLLKLYIYGYLNRVRSSRLREREPQRNLEVMWLLKKLRPDFKTIADFGKDNLQPSQKVCRAFRLLCNQFDLFGAELLAIDGCRFKAVNSRKRNFNHKNLKLRCSRLMPRSASICRRSTRQIPTHLPARTSQQPNCANVSRKCGGGSRSTRRPSRPDWRAAKAKSR